MLKNIKVAREEISINDIRIDYITDSGPFITIIANFDTHDNMWRLQNFNKDLYRYIIWYREAHMDIVSKIAMIKADVDENIKYILKDVRRLQRRCG